MELIASGEIKATDLDSTTGSDSIDITVGNPLAGATTVTVELPSGTNGYATERGKNQDKHLLNAVALVDDLGNPVSGASVSIELHRNGSLDQAATRRQ